MLDGALHFLAIIGPETVEQWLQAGGYFMLFGILFICGLGLPLPEDIPLIAAGILISNQQMHWVPACIAAWLGIMGGDMILYHIGKKFGPNVTKIPFIGKHINVKRLGQVEVWFAKYGIWVIAIGRMFAGIRGAVIVTAGTTRFSLIKLIIADGLAAIVSGGLFILLGYWLGQNLPMLMHRVSQGKGILMGVALVALIAGAIWYWRRRRRISAQNALPNPNIPPTVPLPTARQDTPAT